MPAWRPLEPALLAMPGRPVTRYVVGLDPSLVRTGITVLACDEHGRAYPVVLRDLGYSLPDTAGWDERMDRVVDQARKIAKIIDRLDATPELLLMEAPIFPKHVLPSYFDRAGLWTGAYSAVKARRIPRAVVQPTSLKKWATGSGRADKEGVLAEVRTWWPEEHVPIANHDVADSAVCAAMCAVRLGWRMPFEVRRRHHAGLDVVRWPEAA